VRDDLHRRSKEIAAAFLGNHGRVDTPRRDVVLLRQRAVDEPFVMTKVEVRFGPVVRDKHFAVLEWRHRPRIDVEIRVELQHRDPKSALDEQPAD